MLPVFYCNHRFKLHSMIYSVHLGITSLKGIGWLNWDTEFDYISSNIYYYLKKNAYFYTVLYSVCTFLFAWNVNVRGNTEESSRNYTIVRVSIGLTHNRPIYYMYVHVYASIGKTHNRPILVLERLNTEFEIY